MSSSPYRKNHSAVETVVGLCMFVFGVGIFLSFFFLFLNAVAPSLWNADPGPRGAGSKVGDNEGAEQGAGKMMNEVLAASCVPGLVEINETCFKVLMCITSDLG